MVIRVKVKNGTWFGFYPQEVYITIRFSVRAPESARVETGLGWYLGLW